jgi:hypothetical protein
MKRFKSGIFLFASVLIVFSLQPTRAKVYYSQSRKIV